MAEPNVFERISPFTDIGKAVTDMASALGAPHQAFLFISGVVADGQTFTVGSRVHELMLLTAAIGGGVTLSGGDLANTTNPALNVTLTAHGLSVGELVLCESEVMEVIKVVDANNVNLARGKYGTTIASHADATAVTKQTSGLTSGNFAIPSLGTSAATAVTDIVRGFNAQAGPKPATAVAIGTDTVGFYSDKAFATAEVMTNAIWQHGATSVQGAAKGAVKISAQSRTIGATEAKVNFLFPFTVKGTYVQVRAAAGTVKAYDGSVDINGHAVTLSNSGTTDAVSTDVVTVIALG
jgi:hypothetical protein